MDTKKKIHRDDMHTQPASELSRRCHHHHTSYRSQLLRSDFAILTFNEHLGNNEKDVKMAQSVQAKWVGNQTTPKKFYIEGEPLFGHAYLLIMAYEVHFGGHTVWINGTQLPFYELPPCKGQWLTSIAPIGIELLGNSDNTVQIRRNEEREDNFIIGHVVVNWREMF